MTAGKKAPVADPDDSTPRESVTVHPDNRELVRQLSNLALSVDAWQRRLRELLQTVWSSPTKVDPFDVTARVVGFFAAVAREFAEGRKP